MTPMMTQSTERFVREILARIPIERVTEMRLFPAMRHGGSETGVAVVASELDDVLPVPEGAEVVSRGDAEAAASTALGSRGDAGDAETAESEQGGGGAGGDGEESDQGVLMSHADRRAAEEVAGNRRQVIYSARYRLLLKGAERGKWEFALTAEAEAPLVTVDSVVRGVLRRSGNDDAAEPERLTGPAIREALRIEERPAAP
jgi:hypothetical protein